MKIQATKPLTSTSRTTSCIQCASLTIGSSSNICNRCQQNQTLARDLPKCVYICFCPNCRRYLNILGAWIHAELRSTELLGVALSYLSMHDITEAHIGWTDPQTRSFKVFARNRTSPGIGQETFDFFISNQICRECDNCRIQNSDAGGFKVELRQAGHKCTFNYVERMIVKHNAAVNATTVMSHADGVDMYFLRQEYANSFSNFIIGTVPCQWSSPAVVDRIFAQPALHAQIKQVTIIRFPPVTINDVVYLPQQLATYLNNIRQLSIVQNVGQKISLIDPATAQIAEIDKDTYLHKCPLYVACLKKDLSSYVIVEIDYLLHRRSNDPKRTKMSQTVKRSPNFTVAEVWLQKSEEFPNGDLIFTRTHLGGIVKVGDTVMGYDCKKANPKLTDLTPNEVAEIIVVNKCLSLTNNWGTFEPKQLVINDSAHPQEDFIGSIDESKSDELLQAEVNTDVANSPISDSRAQSKKHVEAPGFEDDIYFPKLSSTSVSKLWPPNKSGKASTNTTGIWSII